jgi:FkbM family methyltransferase
VHANRLAQIVVEARAAADRPGSRRFQAPQAGDLWDGTGRLVGDQEPRGGAVECVTLDQFTAERELGRVDLVKIDVEGWELAVLRGAIRLLGAARPVVLFEYDPAYISRCGGSGAALTSYLHDSGYRLYGLAPGRPPLAVARLGERDGNFLAVPAEKADR